MPRDPERIDRIVDKLREVWHTVPDWRLGQLVSNLIGPGRQDVFYREDDEWEASLDHVVGAIRAEYPLGAVPPPRDEAGMTDADYHASDMAYDAAREKGRL